jgi:hypothetical protein
LKLEIYFYDWKIFMNYTKIQLFLGASTTILATALLSAPVQAQTIITDQATLNSILEAHTAQGDTIPQRNTGAITTTNTDFDAVTANTGITTNGTFENNANIADATAIANRNGIIASLATIGSSTGSDDGIAISGVSDNAGAVNATTSGADIGTNATDFATGSVDVSRNTISSNVVINEGSDGFRMAITGSEPVDYTNVTTSASVTTDLSASATNVSDMAGDLLVSSVQIADAALDSAATTSNAETYLTIQTTTDATVTGTATLDGNVTSASFTANARDASIGLAADDGNTSTTAAISNAQRFDANTTASSATTTGIVSAQISGSTATDTTSFNDSSLSVASNTLSAEASGNTANTSITLADSLAYNTATAADTATASIDQLDASSVKLADVNATGGLVGVNTQLVQTGTLQADLTGQVDVDVASSNNSSTDVSTNRLTSTVTGNNLTANIASGDNSAVFDASAVLASRQELATTAVTANSTNSGVFVDVGGAGDTPTFVSSAVTVDSNVLAASAVGNRGRQTIGLEATALNAAVDTSATLSADATPPASGESVTADGAAVIASAMINTGSAILASNTGSDIDVTIDDTDDTADANALNTNVAVTTNTQQAFAVGSDTGNSLSLTGVDVGSAAGISSLQTNDATSTVTATQTASIDVVYNDGLISGSGEISGNNQSAIARGTVAANTLTADAQVVALGAGGTATTSSPTSIDADATAAFGVVNVQQVLANVTATTEPDDTNAFRMDVAGDITDANTAVNSNTLMAQAQGTVAANAVSLDVGTLTSTASSGDVAIANLQNVSGGNILATANGDDDNVIETEIDGAVLRSSVETSNNRIIASAESARASNLLSVTGTSLSGSALAASSDAEPATNNTVTAQFGIANTQVAGTGDVTASLRETAATPAFADSSAVVTDLNGSVTSSAIASSGNLLQALASSNRATNVVDVDGTTLDQATAGLGNVQVSSQDVSALIGFAGTAATAGTSSTVVSKSGTASQPSGDTSVVGTTVSNTSTTTPLSFTVAALSAAEATYLTSLGFSGATTGSTTVSIPASSSVNFSAFNGFTTSTSSGTTTITFTGFTIPGTAGSTGTFNAGGVLVDAGGVIGSSTIAVEGNAVQGSAIGNSAANFVDIASTTTDGVTVVGDGDVVTAATGTLEAVATADTSLASSQTLSATSSSTTELFTMFGIDGALDTAITDSNLSVSGNSAYGEAIGNTVSNSLTVAGTDLAGTATSGVLSNMQDGTSATILASSDMEVASNVVSSGSNVSLDRNANNALGVVNNATNNLTASSTNSTASAQAIAVSDVLSGTGTSNIAAGNGSFALVNGQSATGTVTTTATTDVYNIGLGDTTTTGVVNGSVSMSNNATRSESTANRASNTMLVGADANLGSTAALVNQQSSSAVTQADATSNFNVGVAGTSGASLESLNNSSVSIEGNSTLALARGNSASNTLNYSAGASYTATAGFATLDSGTNRAQASAAVLNDQSNTGPVTANARGSTSIALNAAGTGTAAGVLNANVSNSNNSTTAFAVGNTATNTVMLSALTTGMPNVALGNQQTNTGPVTATATSVTYSMNSNGTVGGSSLQNSGNAASATAIGNSSVSVIGAN